MTTKLSSGQKHLLKLVMDDADAEGWTPVSKPVFPLIEKLPSELVNLESVGNEGKGRAKLTEEGVAVMAAMAWL